MEPILKNYKDNMTFDDLVNFMQWPALSINHFRGCRSIIIEHKSWDWLVIERITFPAGVELPPHRHPSVSVLDFGVSGGGEFFVGRRTFRNDESNPAKLPLYVPRNVAHGGKTTKETTIISFQYWHEWPPKDSIFLDWSEG